MGISGFIIAAIRPLLCAAFARRPRPGGGCAVAKPEPETGTMIVEVPCEQCGDLMKWVAAPGRGFGSIMPNFTCKKCITDEMDSAIECALRKRGRNSGRGRGL